MPPLHRRDFLRGAAAGVGLGLFPLATARASEEPRIRRHVRLGRTGLEISDIGFGSSRLRDDPDLVRRALDRGITYFDTAEGYTGGTSETTIGQALEGVRDRIVLVSKVKAGADDRVADLMPRLEGSLRRLRTDYLDVYFNHAVNDVDRITNPEWAEFTERAKEQGKIRWRGMSGHGGHLAECLDAALERDVVDVVLVAFNFGQDPRFLQRFTEGLDFVARQPGLEGALARAKQKDVGVVAMKTLRGARLNDMRPYETGGATFAQAALRWTLSHPHSDALVITMKNPEHVDEYLGASGWTRPRAGDFRLLARYEERNGATQCRYGCSACLASCPAGVAIPDVLRSRMYARDYGDLEFGREAYAGLEANADPCLSCAVPTCACPHGLPIADLTRDAARLLS